MRVARRLAELAPPPGGVTVEGIAQLDARMLKRWNAVLEPTWSTRTLPLWERALRRVQGWVVG